jgi:streptogramin lyase
LAGISGSSDGSGSTALFNQPRGLTVDSSGNVYVADTANSAIRKVTPSGIVTTVAGLSTIAGLLDGTGTEAWLNQPRDVKMDAAGNLYIADTGNAAIRMITPAEAVSTPSIVAASAPVTPPGTTTGTGNSAASEGPPPGKAGAGSMEGWFVLGLLVIASASYTRKSSPSTAHGSAGLRWCRLHNRQE